MNIEEIISKKVKEEREKLSNIIEEYYKNIISPDLENFIEEHYISKQEVREKIENIAYGYNNYRTKMESKRNFDNGNLVEEVFKKLLKELGL